MILFLFTKNSSTYFYLWANVFFNLFLLKEMIVTIQFDFIYKKIIFATLIWKIIFTNLFKKFWFYLGKKKF